MKHKFDGIKETGNDFRNFFKAEFAKINKIFCFIKNEKKCFLFLALSCILLSLSCSLSILCSSYFPINSQESISELLSEKKCLDGMGVIYAHECVPNTYELSPVNPEKSKELRSLNIAGCVYDAYVANENLSIPIVLGENDNKQSLSLLLLPKGGYLDKFFSPEYKFELLAGGLSDKSSLEDIFINQKYADELIEKNNEYSSYESLVNEQITLPFYNKKNNEFINNVYIIKGVIDEKCDNYKKYSNYIGDFFLGNQYLSLPINSVTLFDIGKTLTEIKKQVKAISKIYSYESSVKYFNALENIFAYEFRITNVNDIKSEYSVINIENNSVPFFAKINQLYDYYLFKQNLMPLIISGILVIFLFAASIILGEKSLNIVSCEKCSNTYKTFIFIAAFAFILGYIFSKPLSLFNLLLLGTLSVNGWYAFAISFGLTVAYLLAIALIKKRIKYE